MTSFAETVPVLMKAKNKDKSNFKVPDDYPKKLQPIYLSTNLRNLPF
jgi:hypothetical protein